MTKKQYISNKLLYKAMVEYRELLDTSKLNNNIKPRASDYIGNCIMLICENLGKKYNFTGYSYKGDMITDAIIDCVAAISNFDPSKTKNPHAYFTQIAWNAFIRRIHKEKKQAYLKHKNYEHMFLSGKINISEMKFDKNVEIMIQSFEDKILSNKKKQKEKLGLELFSGDKSEK